MVLSPVLGPIAIREISSGAKALITMNTDDSVISNANSCGDNCAALLAELSREKDFEIFLAYPMNFEGLEFDMCIARDGAVTVGMMRSCGGDSGVGSFFISAENLAKCDFSRVLYTWDCC